jgi:hypothetical protein
VSKSRDFSPVLDRDRVKRLFSPAKIQKMVCQRQALALYSPPAGIQNPP